MGIDERDDEGNGSGGFRIHVRTGADAGAAGPATGGGSGEHPAASVEPPPFRGARGTDARDDASGDDGDPVIVSIDDEPASETSSEPTVARGRYLELARENMRLNEQVKKLQSDLYQANARAQAADAKTQEQRESVARAQAEFQNYRRRLDREREDSAKYANSDLIRDLLPVLDNFDRAMKMGPGTSPEDFHKGIALIDKQFQDVLANYELKAMDVLGQAFDPNVHEAVTRAEHPTIPADQVMAEHQKGYFYKDRLLRPAMVGVSAGGPEDAGGAGGGDDKREGDVTYEFGNDSTPSGGTGTPGGPGGDA